MIHQQGKGPTYALFRVSWRTAVVPSSGFRGGGGRTSPRPSGIRPLQTQRVPLLYYFEIAIFWMTDPKIFLKAPLAPKYFNFEMEARADKT